MSYTKQNFKKGDILTADHLNHMENGIEELFSVCDGGSGDSGLEFVCDLVKSDVGLELTNPCIMLNFPENSGLSLEANTQYVLTFILGGYVDYAYDFYWFGASTYSQRDFPILIDSGNPATTGLVTLSLGYSQSTFANMFMCKSTGENVVSQFYDYIQNIKLYKRK